MPAVDAIIGHDPLFKYLADIQDAVVGGPLTAQSRLAKLYLYGDAKFPHNRLLRDLSGLSTFAIKSKVHISDANTGVAVSTVPAPSGRCDQDIEIYTRFVNCLTAPAIRLEARFLTGGDKSDVFHTLILDFHFNDCDGKQLSDFKFELAGQDGDLSISFATNGATCEGFNLLSGLSVTQHAVFHIFHSLIAPGARQRLCLEILTGNAQPFEVDDLKQVLRRLPGGEGPLLPTIGCPEYQNFLPDFQSTLNPLALLQRSPPIPFVPLYSGDTFASIRDYEAQQANAISSPYYEHQTTLDLFTACKADHEVTLHQVENYYREGGIVKVEKFVVIAMNFAINMKRIGGTDSKRALRLPKEMEIEISLRFPALAGQDEQEVNHFPDIIAHHEISSMGLKKHDAYFVVTSHDPKLFQGFFCDTNQPTSRTCKVYKLEPHRDSFLHNSLQEALTSLTTKDEFAYLRPILLNQLHDSIPVVNFTDGLTVIENVLRDAKDWLDACRPWNQEQLQAIEDMHAAKGGLQIVTGVAGTGKTTLQIAQALYIVKMGGRALCTATGNSNADHWAREARKLIDQTPGSGIRAYRLYPASKGVNIKTLQKAQAKWKRAGHTRGGRTSSLRDLMFRFFDETKSDFDFSIEKAVLEEAKKGELSYTICLDPRNGMRINAWTQLRIYMKKIENDKFKWGARTSGSDVEGLTRVYEACKSHLIALADVIITTNGNARCHELRESWGKAEQRFGCHQSNASPQVRPIAALGVFIDEAGKEQEINIVNTLTSPGLFRKPDIVVLYGDDRQLGPVNTCNSEKFQIALFLDRLNISLLGRLLRQGFPHNKLLVQHRMHTAISRNPNRMFYDNALIDAPAVNRDLNDALPGLSTILHKIIAKSSSGVASHTDDQARLHWLETGIADVAWDDKGSAAIMKHIDLFFEKVFLDLHDYFGDRTHEEVMIIAAYNHALNQYEQRFRKHRDENRSLDMSHYPRVLTIDASQGQEANMVIVDGSMQYSDKMSPFLQDRGRANVAMTRAKHILWILGGPMEAKDWGNREKPPSPFVELKRQLDKSGQVHRFS